MPKIRDHKRPSKQTFLVSPWQSKRQIITPSSPDAPPAAATGTVTAAAPGPCMYSVLTSEALLMPRSHESTIGAATPAPAQQQGLQVAYAAHTSLLPNLESNSGWHTRRKHPTAASQTHQAAAASTAVHTACQLKASAAQSPGSPHHHHAQQQEQEQQQQCQRQQKRQRLEKSSAVAAGSSTSDMSANATEAEDGSMHETDTASQGGYQGRPSTQLSTETPSDDWRSAETPATAAAAGSCSAGGTCGPAILEGAAQLVLHPSGHISGHFVALNNTSSSSRDGVDAGCRAGNPFGGQPVSSSTAAVRQPDRQDSSSQGGRRACLGLQGRQVLGIHSCYRDPEWALLQLSIIRHSRNHDSSGRVTAAPSHEAAAAGGGVAECIVPAAGGTNVKAESAAAQEAGQSSSAAAATVVAAAGAAVVAAAEGPGNSSSGSEAEAVAWVQRKGGDLVTLEPADFDDEDSEAAVLAENFGELPANIILNFTAHKLLCGSAAGGVLQDSWPELVGQPDVVVNLGDMSIAGLPAGFLQGV